MNGVGEVVVLLGASGAGKSLWWRRLGAYQEHQVLSLDDMRLRLTDDTANQGANPAAVELRRILLENRLQRGLPTLIDATNTVREHRAAITATARRWHRPTIAVVFHTPLQCCLDRQENADRVAQQPGQPNGRSTPPEAVKAMHHLLGTVWDRMSLEADCVVHVSPGGGRTYRIGDIVTPPGETVTWLRDLPCLPSAEHLPWDPPWKATR